MIRDLIFVWLFIFFQTLLIAVLHHTIFLEQVEIFKQGLFFANLVVAVSFIYRKVVEEKGP